MLIQKQNVYWGETNLAHPLSCLPPFLGNTKQRFYYLCTKELSLRSIFYDYYDTNDCDCSVLTG